MAEMSKWERIGATIAGEPTDRSPYSFWRHFYDRETSAEDLAAVMVEWQRRHDFDLLKVNPRAQYHSEAWGARYRYSGKPHVGHTTEWLPVRQAEDWQRLDVVAPTDGALGEQLRALQLIRRRLGGETPFVQTLFSPLGVAGYLIGDDTALLAHLREQPRLLHQGLGAITQTLIPFVHEVLNAGADGLFFATTHWATYDRLTDAEYDEFGRPYDLQVLRAANQARLNVLHVCQDHNMLARLLDYPVQLINWAVGGEGNPTLPEIAERADGRALMGGVGNEALTAPDVQRALDEAAAARDAMGRRGWMLAGDCSIPTTAREETLASLRDWARRS